MLDIAELLTKTGHWTAEDDDGETIGTGSCWSVTSDLVVTNFHVASLGPKATVEFEHIGVMPIMGLVAIDKPRDLAIAKVRTGKAKLPVFEVYEDLPKAGIDIYVLGSPFGLRRSVSRGIVSAIRPATDLADFGIKGRKSDRFVQVDAAISQGCSGGPIVDNRGTVVAVSTFIITKGQSLNFGVPSAYVCELLDLAEECRPLHQYYQPNSVNSTQVSHNSNNIGSLQSAERDIVDHIIRLYSAVIFADGSFSQNEERIIFQVSREWGFSHNDVVQAMNNFDIDSRSYDMRRLTSQSIIRLKHILNERQRNALLEDLVRISRSDGMTTEEVGVIIAMKEIWDSM